MDIQNLLKGKTLILASGSPRRRYLLKELGFEFTTITPLVREEYPESLNPVEIARYLAELKSFAIELAQYPGEAILITADTLVVINGKILGKPSDYEEAANMLRLLSGHKHDVVTGVCLRSNTNKVLFHTISSVFFRSLEEQEIDYYVRNFHPFDKAGGYGVQEWIGYVGIERIEGSFFNIMGLPLKELYEELLMF